MEEDLAGDLVLYLCLGAFPVGDPGRPAGKLFQFQAFQLPHSFNPNHFLLSKREAGMRFADSKWGDELKMISAVLRPFLFLTGHEGERLPASRTEDGGMQMLKHFSVCPDYLFSPSSFIRVRKFILRARITPCLLTLYSLGGHSS